jgi:hypothetical protein
LSPAKRRHAPAVDFLAGWIHTRGRRRKGDHHVPIHNTILAEMFGSNKSRYKVWPEVEPDIIVRDGAWRAGEKSLGWRLAQPWADRPTEIRQIADPRTSELMDRFFPRIRRWDGNPPSWIAGAIWHWCSRLTVDTVQVEPLFGDLSTPGQRYRQMTAQRVLSGEHRVKESKWGRLTNVVTIAPRDVRACFRLDGEPLRGRDTSGSQVYLAVASILNPMSSAKRVRKRESKRGGRAEPPRPAKQEPGVSPLP